MKPEVSIYTDGACSGNPGPGGYGAVLLFGDHRLELSGFDPQTTNNRMEIIAAIAGLKALKKPCKATVFTDSAYLCHAFTKGWVYSWTQRGWLKADGKSQVENRDLWMELLQLTMTHVVEFVKVAGHTDVEENNRCDKLAREAIKAGLRGME